MGPSTTPALVVAVVLLGGCGSDRGAGTGQELTEVSCTIAEARLEDCTPTGFPVPGQVAPSPATRVEATTTGLGGVALGTPAEAAIAALQRALGPGELEETSCLRSTDSRSSEPMVRKGQSLRWGPGSFHAYTVQKDDGQYRFSGWHVGQQLGRQRFTFALPYDVQQGDSIDRARDRIPAAQQSAPADGPRGESVLTTPRRSGVVWLVRDHQEGGPTVAEVSYDPDGCH